MRTLVLRPLSTVGLLLLGLLVLRVAIWPKSGKRFAEAHRGAVVLFGDSHADDVQLEEVPRFSASAQDLVVSWMYMRALHEARTEDSELKVVVLTVWPYKFGPIAEKRLTGMWQDDHWGSSAFGAAAPVVRWSDLLRPELPWRYRWRLFLNAAQLERVRSLMGFACQDNPVGPDYRVSLGTRARSEPWFADATVSRWAFSKILSLSERAGWELVLLEHPLHPIFQDQVHPVAMADYTATMEAAAEHPRVHYLALGHDSVAPWAFRDFHHLTCEGGVHVSGHLQPLLDRLRK